jgi:hypothetical protein
MQYAPLNGMVVCVPTYHGVNADYDFKSFDTVRPLLFNQEDEKSTYRKRRGNGLRCLDSINLIIFEVKAMTQEFEKSKAKV